MAYIITIVLLILEIVAIAFSIGIAGFTIETAQYYRSFSVGISILELLIAVCMLTVSIVSTVKLRRQEEVMKRQRISLTCLVLMWGAGFVLLAELYTREPVPGVMLLFGGTYLVSLDTLLYFCLKLVKDKREEDEKNRQIQNSHRDKQMAEIMEKSYFTYDNAEWYYDDALREYAALHEKLPNIDELTEKEKSQIFDYAGIHMAYLLAWLADRELLSAVLMDDIAGEIAQDIYRRKCTGTDLLQAMDYKIQSTDLGAGEPKEAFEYRKEQRRTYKQEQRDDFVHAFLGHYINALYPFINHSFHAEFGVIVAENGINYCHEFSWDKYDIFAKLMNKRYAYYIYFENQQQIEENYDSEEVIDDIRNNTCTITNDRWWLDVKICARPDVSDGYITRVMESFRNMSEELQEKIASAVIDTYLDQYVMDIVQHNTGITFNKSGIGDRPDRGKTELSEAIGEIQQDPKELFYYDDLFGNLRLEIYAPRDESVIAYVLAGESWLEEEHGISVSIFNGNVVETGNGYDFENPWLREVNHED